VSDLSLSLSRPSSLSSHFLSPVQLGRGSDRMVLVGTWHLPRSKQNTPTFAGNLRPVERRDQRPPKPLHRSKKHSWKRAGGNKKYNCLL